MRSDSCIPLVVCGAAGRMGRELIKLIAHSNDVFLLAAVEAADHPAVGSDAGVVAGCGKLDVTIVDALEPLLNPKCVVLDFTTPRASLEHARMVRKQSSALVLGTTGFSPQERQELTDLLRGVRAVVSANMSVGVTVMLELVKVAAKLLGTSFDVEIVEIHHRMKKDAPSGTAIALAQAAVPPGFSRTFCFGREGQRPRRDDEIGVFGLRGGDIVGDHTVLFAGLGERLELTHRLQSRESLARGALRAALWVSHQPPGWYSMADVLGIRDLSASSGVLAELS